MSSARPAPARLVAAFALAITALGPACGGGSAGQAGSGGARGAASPPAQASADPAATAAGPAITGEPGAESRDPDSAPGQAECEAMLDHVLRIVSAEKPELESVEEDFAKARAELAPEFMPACLALDRAAYDCQMRATTRQELVACTAPGQ